MPESRYAAEALVAFATIAARTRRPRRRDGPRRRRRARHRRPPGTHDARTRAPRPLSRRDRKGRDDENRRAARRQRAPGGADLGRASLARSLVDAARARHGGERWRLPTAPAPSSSAAPITSPVSRPTCLRATDRGLIGIVQSSDPTVAAVVPHGGLTPIVTPNPIAAGLPTSGDPILIDISSSITSMGFARQEMNAGRKLPGPWLIDHEGRATDDPGALFADPKGALLPLGGIDAGYKGFGLALLIEALTAGLSGFGRADPLEGWGGTIFVQAIDPEAFGGLAAFKRQMDHLVATSHASKPRRGCRARAPSRRGRDATAARATPPRRCALSDDPARARAVGRETEGGPSRRGGAMTISAAAAP